MALSFGEIRCIAATSRKEWAAWRGACRVMVHPGSKTAHNQCPLIGITYKMADATLAEYTP